MKKLAFMCVMTALLIGSAVGIMRLQRNGNQLGQPLSENPEDCMQQAWQGTTALWIVPSSFDEMVIQPDLIAVGVLTRVNKQYVTMGFDQNGTPSPQPIAVPGINVPLPGIPFAEYALELRDVLKVDSARPISREIVFISSGPARMEPVNFLTPDDGRPVLGQEYLFLLSRDRFDNIYGQTFAWYGRLVLDGPQVRVTNHLQCPLAFDAKSFDRATLFAEIRARLK